jgi:EmrB/QacA subfamily drug resistance transporter
MTKSSHITAGRTAEQINQAMVLAIILVTYVMIILDGSVVITMLPNIRESLHFSATGLSWVQNGYTLAFGGLMLLGARMGDLLGRRRVFVAGIGLFTASSFLGGIAPTGGLLLGARVLQGIGAAIAAPSSLSLLMVTFKEGPERIRAIGWYSAAAGGGASVGVVLGGVLAELISWRAGLFINVPIGIVLMWLAPRYLPETERLTGKFDLAGAITSTLGMTAFVYGFVRAASKGWGDDLTIAAFVAGIALLASFVLGERRAAHPITPLRLFGDRSRVGAYIARILVVSGMFSMFFFVSQFLQGALEFTPLQAGLAFVPMTGVLFVMVQNVSRLVRLLGERRMLLGGIALAMAALGWLSQLSETTSYAPGILVPMMLLGVGMGMAFVPLTSAGIAGVAPEDAGAASGVVNVAHQMGGALGIAVFVNVFSSASRDAAEHPLAGVSAAFQARHDLATGVSSALTGSVIAMALGLLVALFVIQKPVPSPIDQAARERELEREAAELELVA